MSQRPIILLSGGKKILANVMVFCWGFSFQMTPGSVKLTAKAVDVNLTQKHTTLNRTLYFLVLESHVIIIVWNNTPLKVPQSLKVPVIKKFGVFLKVQSLFTLGSYKIKYKLNTFYSIKEPRHRNKSNQSQPKALLLTHRAGFWPSTANTTCLIGKRPVPLYT